MAGNTNQGVGNANKPKKRRPHPPGKPYRWDNKSFHTRKQGAQYRTNQGPTGGGHHHHGGGGGGGGGQPQRPVDPLLLQAQQMGGYAYNPQIRGLQRQLGQVGPWFQDYVNKVTAGSNLYTQQSQPVLQQAQQLQQTAGQVTPGTEQDPEAQLAAQSRAALTGLGLTALQGIVNAQQGYFAGQAGPVAAAGALSMKGNLSGQLSEARKQKGEYVATKYTEAKDTAHRQKLEDKAFGVKASEAASQLNKYGYTDSEWNSFSSARKNRIRGRASQGSKPDLGSVNKYGYTEKDWRKLSTAERQKIIHDFSKTGGQSGGKLTAGQVTRRDNAKEQIRKGRAAIKRSLEGKEYAPAGFWTKAYNDLLDGGYDPLLARTVIQIAKHGHVGSKLKNSLWHEYRIRHPGRGPKTKVPKPFTANPPPQAPGPNGQPRPT